MLFAPKGNLVMNGDFESGALGAPPTDWISTNVSLVGAEFAFTGAQAASMGEVTPTDPAVMFQDISVVPGQRYQLTFQMGVAEKTGGDLIVEVRWLTDSGRDTGLGLHVFISGIPSPQPKNGIWEAQVHLTDFAPTEASIARLIFSRSPSVCRFSPTIIDAVTFADTN